MAGNPNREFLHVPSGLIVHIEPDTSSGFFATVPALPGCGSQGETVDETLENLSDAIAGVLAVLEEDQPERFEQIMGTATYREAALVGETSASCPNVSIVSVITASDRTAA